MDDTYRFLRRVEHRLQILFDRQTHRDAPRPRRPAHPGPADGLPAGQPLGRAQRPDRTVHDRLSQQDRAQSPHLESPAPRRLQRRRRRQAVDPIVDLVLDPEAQSAEFICGGACALPVSRSAHGLPQPDGAGARRLSVPVAGPLPPLPGGDCPAAPRGRQPHPRPRHDSDEPRESLGAHSAPRRSSGSCSTSIPRACGSMSSCARPASFSRRS